MFTFKNLRTVLWAGLGVALLANYSTWVRDYAAKDAAAAATVQAAEIAHPPAALSDAIPQAVVPSDGAANATVANPGIANSAPAGSAIASSATASSAADIPVAAAPPATGAAPGAADTSPGIVNVRTDVLDLDINLRGGDLERADLLAYPLVKNQPAPVRLLRRHGAGDTYLLQTGLTNGNPSAGGEFPTHLAAFTSDFTGFVLQSGADTMRVPLHWTSPDGVAVTKTFIFKRGNYRIDLEYSVDNQSASPWSVASYAQIFHDLPPVERSYFKVESYAFTGPALYDGKKYRKLTVTDKDDASLSQDITGGWIAGLQHHFVTAIAPARDAAYHYSLGVRGNEYRASALGTVHNIAAGSTEVVKETLFVGPKLQTELAAINPDLDRVADYGVLTFLARPLFWLLNKAHAMLGNWGMAIVAITFLLKLAFYPLSEASGKAMAKMKLVAPRMKQIQEMYKDDREKLTKATMELYKKEKVNPAAGCLPMIIQMPVFFAFYWVLLESVEMRQAPFFGWIQDISARDPLFILPLLMAGAMFVQYKLNPAPADPVQAKVMMILPLVMSATFTLFPAGLVLYYVVNTLLSIAQQWNINRRIEAASTART
jgi:YidC/Oxa1 family membrane protein insertase